MRENLYRYEGEGPVGIGYDRDQLFITWENVADFDEMKQHTINKKNKLYQSARLDDIVEVEHIVDSGFVIVVFNDGKKKKDFRFAFYTKKESKEFVAGLKEACRLTIGFSGQQTMKPDLTKEYLGVAGTVIFGGGIVLLTTFTVAMVREELRPKLFLKLLIELVSWVCLQSYWPS